MTRRATSLVLFAALIFAADPLGAADGVRDIKISPTATFVISTSGSYRLVSDVTMTANVRAITISTSYVTIDLGGHTIKGAAGSTTEGIHGAGAVNITIFGGTVRDFGLWGIVLGHSAIVRDCSVQSNNSVGGTGGVMTLTGSLVERCSSLDNVPTISGSATGISVGSDSQVRRSISGNNSSPSGAASGITSSGSQSNCVFEGNTVTGTAANGASQAAYGINGGGGSLLRDNVVLATSGDFNVFGIAAGNGSTVEGNTSSDNAATGSLGDVFGIYAVTGCTIRGNTAHDNDHTGTGSAYGIYAGTACTIEANTCRGNTEGPGGQNVGVGIFGGSRSTIINNTCSENGASGLSGGAIGIEVNSQCAVRGNTCTNNAALGTGLGAGIRATGNANTLEANHSTGNTADVVSAAYGIIVDGNDGVLRENHTTLNTTGGIALSGAGNYAELNRNKGGAAFVGSANDVLATGDLGNVSY